MSSAIALAKPSDSAQEVAAVLRQHCVKCHAAESDSGIELVDIADENTTHRDLIEHAELVSQVIDVLDLHAMPPEEEPELGDQDRARVISALKSVLAGDQGNRPRFRRTPIRRMNRFQYNNAVDDLFDLRCIVFTLPERMMREHRGYFKPATGKMADVVSVGSRPLGKSQMIEPRLAGVAAFPQDLRAEHGFDNRGDHLSLSPLLMESFLKLGDSITQSPDFTRRNVGIWDAFFAPPSDPQDLVAEVRDRLRPFLTRAFRRPVSQATLDRYTQFVTSQIDSGVDFTSGMKSVAAAAIASPKFLYLFDQPGSNTEAHSDASEPVDDFELAARLSFFLWGGPPDEELLRVAEDSRLSQPETLRHQINRMLRSHKLKRFCDSFPSQWLQLDRIVSSVPDREKYPDFYFSKYRDSMHMMLEPLLLFETVLIENRPITDLIDPGFSYRTVRLEKAYGSLASSPEAVKRKAGNEVTVLPFKRVPITDRRSGGIITNAAVMTMTSGPERTQPITRGAWIATVIFNNPPEPPPADVPPLDEKPSEDEANLTLRERLSKHRERSDCKGCHEQIDPLGFALENYDAIGKWRDQYENGREVDMQGELFRRHSFENVVEFKDAVLAEKDRFTRGLAGHLLSFALGRELGAADQPALDQITQKTAEDGYRMQTLLRQVIFSEPFLMKTHAAD
ncbi:MAG: DUF1588 domain-containing protein [Planctomycetota bacterium]